MGVSSPSYRLFVLASVCLHVALLFLVPLEWVTEFLGQEVARPRGLSATDSAEALDSWRIAARLEVIDIELLRDADRPRTDSYEEAQLLAEDRAEEAEPVEPRPEEFEVSEFEAIVQPPAAPPPAGGAPAEAAMSPAGGDPGPAVGSPEADVLPPILPPVQVGVVWPVAPPEARRRRVTTVNLMVHVTTDGTVSEVKVAEPTGCLPCEQVAVRAAHQIRWRPAMRGSTPVDAWIPYTVIFKR